MISFWFWSPSYNRWNKMAFTHVCVGHLSDKLNIFGLHADLLGYTQCRQSITALYRLFFSMTIVIANQNCWSYKGYTLIASVFPLVFCINSARVLCFVTKVNKKNCAVLKATQVILIRGVIKKFVVLCDINIY